MTVIYIDVLFMLNLIVDYVLLMACARITGAVFTQLRLACGAVLGALYAAALFLPGCGWLAAFPCKLCAGFLMICTAFGTGKGFLKRFLVFMGSSAALGGVVLALQLLGSGGMTMENGVLYTGFNLRMLLATVILCYVALKFAFGRVARHGGGKKDLCAAQIELWGKSLEVTVLLDTGNTLTDPSNNRPVMVVEAQAMKRLLPVEIDAADPVKTMEKMEDSRLRQKLRLLPYRAVGVEHGLLLAVRSERVVLGGREIKGLLVALSPTPVSDGGGYQALVGDL